MVIVNTRFREDLLSVLSDKPDRLAFRAVRSILDTWPGVVSDDVIATAREFLATWPDEVCEIAGEQEPTDLAIVSESWPLVRSCLDADPNEIANRINEFQQARLVKLSLRNGSESSIRNFSLRITQPQLRHLSVWPWRIQGNLVTLFFSYVVPDQLESLLFGCIYEKECWEALWNYLCSSRAACLRKLGFTEVSTEYLRVLFSNPPQNLSIVDCTLTQETIALLEETKAFAMQMRELRSTYRLFGDEGAAALGNCSSIVQLECLDLHACNIGPAGITSLASASFMSSLGSLSLYGNSIGDEGCVALSQIPTNHLKILDLRRIDCTEYGVSRLAGSRLFGKLEELNLGGNSIADKGAIAIAESGGLKATRTLRKLYLWQAGIGDEGVTKLSVSDVCAELQQFYLSGNAIGDLGIASLASSPQMGNLRVLDIEANNLTQRGIEAIANSKTMLSLEKLSIGGLALNTFDAEIVYKLAISSVGANLREFTLTCSGFSDESAQILASDSQNWRRLRVLEIHDSQLTDAGLQALAESPNLKGLWVLRITGPTVSFGNLGIRSLADSGFSQLIELELSNVACDTTSISALVHSPSMRRLEQVDIKGSEETWLSSSSIRPILRHYLEVAVRAKQMH